MNKEIIDQNIIFLMWQILAFAGEKDNLLDGLLEGLFHLLVPQCIYKWIHHRSNRSIQNCYSFRQGCLFFCWRVSIHEYTASIRNGNDNNVRGACRKCLFFSDWQKGVSELSWWWTCRIELLMPKWKAESLLQSKNQPLQGAMCLSRIVSRGGNSHKQSGQWC